MNVLQTLCKTSAVAAVLIGLAAPQARAVAPGYRVTGEHNADMGDLARFREFREWRHLEGRDLALAVWKYLCGYETGLYHFNEILEPVDPFDEYATVRDPLKIMNVYNMGYCGIFGPVLDGVFQGMGFETGRSFGLVNWNHCATELRIGGRWNYFDLDVRGLLLRPDGEIASLAEAQARRDLWVDPPAPIEPFFPNDPDKDRVYNIYKDSEVYNYYRWFEGGHSMDIVLRPGEALTRWWHPQGGRWHHLPRYNEVAWIKNLLLEPPVGMKPNHRHFSPWNHGNGLFEYAPNLTDASRDFERGALRAENAAAGPRGAELIRDGRAEILFDVNSPYVIVAKINDLEDESDDAGASVIRLETGLPAECSVSLDNGLTWSPLGETAPGAATEFDPTPLVKGRYGYWFKIAAEGSRGDVLLRSIRMETWTQVAPVSLPRLKKGSNRFAVERGDRHGMTTIPLAIQPNAGDPDDLRKYASAMPERYDPARHTERIKGDVTIRLADPLGRKIAWASVGGAFRTHQGEAARATDNRIAYALDGSDEFTEIHRSNVPEWVSHWRYNWDGEIHPETPAREIHVKYTGDPAVNTVRACLHLVPERPVSLELEVVHGFLIDGRPHTVKRVLNGPGEYAIHCEGEPDNRFIRMRTPSSSR